VIAKEAEVSRLANAVNENSLYGGERNDIHFIANLNAILIADSQLESFITEPVIGTHMFIYHLIANSKTGTMGFMDMQDGLDPKDYCEPGFYVMENHGSTIDTEKTPGEKDNRNAVNATHNYSILAAHLMSSVNPHLVFTKTDDSGQPVPITLIDRKSIEAGFKRQIGKTLSESLVETLASGKLENIKPNVLNPLMNHMQQNKNFALMPFFEVLKLMSTTVVKVVDLDYNKLR
jgi:hypothetical protein